MTATTSTTTKITTAAIDGKPPGFFYLSFLTHYLFFCFSFSMTTTIATTTDTPTMTATATALAAAWCQQHGLET
jgi:hypothetical protein